jgi:Ser/Thr protein kinase RdoA (MazF antagonist)
MDKTIRDRYSDAILHEAMARYDIAADAIEPRGGFESYIYHYQSDDGPAILRVTHSLRRSADQIHGEVDWINYLAAGGATVAGARLSARGELVEEIDDRQGGRFLATAFAYAPGRPPNMDDLTPQRRRAYGRLIGRMHALTKDYTPANPAWRRGAWPAVFDAEIRALLGGSDDAMLERYLRLTQRIERLPRDRDGYGLIHFDAHGGNLHLDDDTVTLFDFDDCVYNWFAADIAIVLFYAITNTDDPEARAASFLPDFLSGYSEANRLDRRWLATLPDFLTTREIDLYAVIQRSYDLPDGEAAEAIPHPWPRRFMTGRRARILAGAPYVDFDFTTLADYL